ncbi:MAG: YXWGXW repeat-containing protein [Chlamydiales bacterium]|nr:YXWGXW repeat-containing protein [Chlamydiales bacterium]
MMRWAGVFFLFVFSFIRLEGNNIQVLKESPVHEAFVTQEFGNLILQAVPDKPPPPITEDSPQNINNGLTWIPGYWHWSRDVGDYIWISGVWRRPPPGCKWISGRWVNYQFGWVWLKGFWSQTTDSEMVYIPEPPPNPLNESVPKPPSPEDHYFWVPGYWEWQSDSQAYRWLSGRWSLIGKLQYVPAQYHWREKGYFLVPGFWDWALESRGVAFAAISIAQKDQDLVYKPSESINPLIILVRLFPHWPNYSTLFRFHFFYHRDLWVSWGAIPPWWSWSTWWSLPVQDSWWLWWWWSHERYPNPPWVTEELAEMITPPTEMALKIMKDATPPPIVTTNGVIGCKELIESLIKVSGKEEPILSSDPKQVEQVQDFADPTIPIPPYLRPKGEEKLRRGPQKPAPDADLSKMKLSPGRVKLPPRYEDQEKQASELEELPSGVNGFESFTLPKSSSNNPPRHTPYYLRRSEENIISNTLRAQKTPRAPPTPTARRDYVQRYRRFYGPAPFQGYDPSIHYEYPQPQLQTQHLNTMMGYPLDKENPAGPRVHQFPGNESTLPNY